MASQEEQGSSSSQDRLEIDHVSKISSNMTDQTNDISESVNSLQARHQVDSWLKFCIESANDFKAAALGTQQIQDTKSEYLF